jgi:hypothetical protein
VTRERLHADLATLLVTFAATVLQAFVVMAVALHSAGSQRDDARQGSIDEAKSQLAVVAAFVPRLVASETPLTDLGRRNLDATWSRLRAQSALRIWRANGSLLYRSPGQQGPFMAPFKPGLVLRHDSAVTSGGGSGGTRLGVYLPVRAPAAR